MSFLRIRALREARGWTIAALAEQAGISPGTAGTYDRDQVIAPHRDVLAKLAQVFGLTISELFADFPLSAATTAVPPARLAVMVWLPVPAVDETVLRLAVDGDGMIIAVSHNCRELVGWQPDQMLGAALGDYSPGDWLRDLLAGETPEYWGDFRHGDGRTVRVRWFDAARVTPGLVLVDGAVRP